MARWSADARIRDTDTRRPTFPSFTLQPTSPPPSSSPFSNRVPRPPTTTTTTTSITTTTRGGCLLSFSSNFQLSLLALFHSASPTPFRRIVRLYRGCDVAFFPLILGRGEGLNGETNHRLSFSSLALLFSDSSGTVRSLASRDSMCRARPILTGFNSVFEGVRRKITWAGRQRERKKGGIDERAARF